MQKVGSTESPFDIERSPLQRSFTSYRRCEALISDPPPDEELKAISQQLDERTGFVLSLG